MAPHFLSKPRSRQVLCDAGPCKRDRAKAIDPEEIRRYYDEWGVKMQTKVPSMDEKWLSTEVKFGHVQHNFASYRTFGDIIRAKGKAAMAVEHLLSLRLPSSKKPQVFYGWVSAFLNGLIHNTLPEVEETSRKPPFGALLTPRALELIKAFKAAHCFPCPLQSSNLSKQSA
jgi:hypothetical protein